MKTYTRKCLYCKLRFEPNRATDTVCSPVCAAHYKATKQKVKQSKRKLSYKPSDKTKAKNKKKMDYYQAMWLLSANKQGACKCEECGMELQVFLPNYISHILTRGAHPKLAFHPLNHNILCCGLGTNGCHEKWEFQDRTKMLIYNKNVSRIEKLYEIERNLYLKLT